MAKIIKQTGRVLCTILGDRNYIYLLLDNILLLLFIVLILFIIGNGLQGQCRTGIK